MAFAHQVWRATIYGTCYGGQEEWSTGFYIGHEDADASVPTQQDVDYIATRWETFFETAVVQISNQYLTTGVKLAQHDEDGSTILANTVFHNYTTQPVGADGNIKYPPQIAYVATMMSDIPRGLGSHGRMYLPGVCCAIETTGRMSSGNTGNKATHFKTFLDGVNTDLGIRGTVILASKGRTVPSVIAPFNKEVTKIRCGDVYDTQRRRRNGMKENYSSQNLA